jgi:hypothetical protein
MVKPTVADYEFVPAAGGTCAAISQLRDRVLVCNAARWPARFARQAEPKALKGAHKEGVERS